LSKFESVVLILLLDGLVNSSYILTLQVRTQRSVMEESDDVDIRPIHYLADVGAALTASFCVAPFIAMIDQAIIQNAAGKCLISLW
jgi:hypothetical protein